MSYKFKPSWLVSTCFFLIIAGLVIMGIEQWGQASNKQTLQLMIDQRSTLEPLSLNMPFEEFAPYQIVQATGRYRARHSILLDNIEYQGQPGYYLITPFEVMASRNVILVNRGWLPQEKNIASLPSFKTPEELITIEGHLSYPKAKSELLNKLSNPLSATPPLWYYMDQDYFSQLHGYPVLPLELKLKAGGQTSTFHSTSIPLDKTETKLIQDWQNYDAESAIHKNHSIQWLIFAALAVIAYIGISLKKETLKL